MADAPGQYGMAERIRRIILEQSRRAHVGHIGSALSIADLVAALYGGVLPQDRAYQTWSSPVAS